MKKLNIYLTEKLKINKNTVNSLIDEIINLCAIKEDEDNAVNMIQRWINDNNIKKVDILCWHETLDNFNLSKNESSYIIDNTNIYSYYIEKWHDYKVYDYISSKSDKFSVSHYKQDNTYLVIGHDKCMDGFKCFILVNHDKLISENDI